MIIFRYGEVVPTGYGCAYSVLGEKIQFNITSKGMKSNHLAHHIEVALLQMRECVGCVYIYKLSCVMTGLYILLLVF